MIDAPVLKKLVQIFAELRASSVTFRTTCGLVADAMTASYDGEHAGFVKAIEQASGDRDQAVCASALAVGLPRCSGVSAGAFRAAVASVIGPENDSKAQGGQS